MGKGLKDTSLVRVDATDAQPIEAWKKEFEAADRRRLEIRMRYAFVRTYKPVLDELESLGITFIEEETAPNFTSQNVRF